MTHYISKGPRVISSFGAGWLPVLPGLMKGPDDILGVELGEAGQDTAAGHHPVAQPLQTIQYLADQRGNIYKGTRNG